MNTKEFIYTAIAWAGLLAAALGMGCATQTKSLGLGGAIGAGAGAIVGGIADPGKDGEHRTRNVIIGTAVGGMAGMVSGSVLHEVTEDQRREAYQAGAKPGTPTQSGAVPALSQPKVEARWIESKVIGNRYVEGHFEYVITEPTRWDGVQ